MTVTVVDLLIWAALFFGLTIKYRQLTVSKRERPDPIAQAILIQSAEERREHWFELKRLEYEKAAERYDNIYRALWQNFSYMAALSAGILTFGAGKIDDDFLFVALALTPLVFWLIANFLPMDHYGDATRTRLKAIEEDINSLYFPEADAPKLGHFILFRDTRYKWRVRTVVGVVGALITAAWLLCLVVAARHGIVSWIR